MSQRLNLVYGVLLLMAITLPWVLIGSRAVDCQTSGLTQWLPDRHVERSRYERFVDDFGGDASLLVSWPGCNLDDERLERFAQYLDASSGSEAEGPEGPLFDEVLTGPRLLHQLTSDPLDFTRDQAISRLTSFVIGPDGQTTGAILRLTAEGQTQQRKAVEMIQQATVEECGLRPDELRMAGAAYEAYVMDLESDKSVRGYTVQAAVLTLIVAWFCLRSLPMIVAIGIAAAYCRLLSMAAVYFTGAHLSAVLIVTPALVYVLTVSGSVHLANYYRDAVLEHGRRGAGWQALRMGWQPCLLAAVSTAIGLGSLGVSQIRPIREFGYYSAVCLMLALVVMLAFVPAVLEWWPFQRRGNDLPAFQRSHTGRVRRWLTQGLPDFVIQHHRWLLVACLLVMAIAGWGLKHTTASVEIEGMFRRDTELVRNYRWLEQHLGPLGTIEVIVGFDAPISLNMLDRVRLVDRIVDTVEQIPEVSCTMSAASILPAVPEQRGSRATLRRTAFRRRVEKNLPLLAQERLLAESEDGQQWRITARVPTLEDVDYSQLAGEITAAIKTATGQLDLPTDVRITHTGLLPMIEVAQRLLLRDLVQSFLLAVLLICPVMILVLRDVRAGILSMVPNVAPIIIVFGAMGWLGLTVDVGSVLTASVALGIAVDDTLHYLKWFAHASDRGLSRNEAIREAYRRCAPAMFQTTLICGLGLLVLTQSAFVPTCRFAVLVCLLLLFALVADLVLLPALLAGRFGVYFERTQPIPTEHLTPIHADGR